MDTNNPFIIYEDHGVILLERHGNTTRIGLAMSEDRAYVIQAMRSFLRAVDRDSGSHPKDEDPKGLSA